MGAPRLAEDFLELLEKSELVSPERIATAAERLTLPSSASAIEAAKALVKGGLITRFQAGRLLKGAFRGFFIGPYKVQDVLGTGGMGLIYVAEDAQSQETVALKVLFEAHREDASMLSRFEAEGRAGQRVRHPNVVRTQKLAQHGGAYYIAMEYVPGISLLEYIERKGAIPWQQACDFICQVAAGVQQVHASGLIHRDVKPHNLIVTAEGVCKLLDFGLAMVQGDRDDFSLALVFGHDCLGTADYVAPEQTVDSNAIDGRADIYSLGCTLY
ncbi:MAG: serine/threonine protein kinase, partial [Planctomycetia bacterium]|nr:serine/threonine protein kinase [Planctomycetia bacterium]